MNLTKEVFPQPVSPIIAMVSPGFATNETFLKQSDINNEFKATETTKENAKFGVLD